MSKIEINGVELELNLLDADVVEEYERLTKKIVARIQNKKAYEGKSNAEAMRYQCRCVDEFFDGLFGPGTSEELLQTNEIYREVYESQVKGGEEDE